MSDNAKLLKNEWSRQAKERKRREAGVPRRNLIMPWFYPDKLAAWLDSQIPPHDVNEPTLLNGRAMTTTDDRWRRRLRDGTTKHTVSLKKADEICTRYDLQFWEMVEAAGRYRVDRRTRHRIAQMKREAA
jgi:hypothetical protein